MKRWTQVAGVMLLFSTCFSGCKDAGKGKVIVHAAPVIEEPTSAEREAAKSAEAKASATSDNDSPAKSPWATRVASIAKKLGPIAAMCNERYLSKLKPDELLVGMPALVTKDGVVTVLERDCKYLAEGYDEAFDLMENQHPKTDELLKRWSLVADLYGRFARTSINIGAKAKRRKMNAEEMSAALPNLTKTLIPEMVQLAEELSQLPADTIPEYPAGFANEAISDAQWKEIIRETAADIQNLETAWMTYAHEPLSKELYVRRRHMGWLDSHWKARLARQKKTMNQARLADSKATQAMRKKTKAFYEACDTWFATAWDTGIQAYADRSLIDEPKLKAAKKAFKTESKAFERAVRKLKLGR